MTSSIDVDKDLTEKGIRAVREYNRDRKRRKVTFYLEAGRTKDIRVELSIKE